MKKTLLPALVIIVASIFATSCQNALIPASTDATLSALTLSADGAPVALSPSFASDTTSYTATVANYGRILYPELRERWDVRVRQ